MPTPQPLEEPPREPIARLGRPMMGTVLQVTVEARDADEARALAEKAFQLARHWEDVLTTWREDGELARFNRAAGKGWQPVSPDLERAFEQMLAFWRRTDGAFDPAVGALVRALRDGESLDGLRRSSIDECLARRPGEALLESGIEIDAGGFGKGLALDRMALALRAMGAGAALLDFGGSSQLGFGTFDGETPRMLVAGLRDGESHGLVALDSLALSTSRSPGSSAAGAIVDPRTGMAIVEPRVVTVAAANATAAEAWSTALIVLGRSGLSDAVESGVEVLYEDESGVVVTPGFPLERRDEPANRDNRSS